MIAAETDKVEEGNRGRQHSEGGVTDRFRNIPGIAVF